MVSEHIETFLLVFELFFEAIGTVIIIYGGLKATVQIFLHEVFKRTYNLEKIRKELTNKILFGLEFYIVVAILGTLRDPSREELLLLSSIVLIRTVLGYFLSKEMKEYRFGE
ncbi:DUF1622 domain-containing protein [Methanosarcina sp. MSH10X1]|uniref:DUF1622 domain-containing protein n=1 Tax=Methanosarcina sp. MSH10X1 TaxID=2507075 RepID=UPI000FFBC2F0|nr:DUF1622 domain-containing protein [Methanosarcina sp. MSH10X1]RXA20186.1 DUF1622 domain-containing protein [Methanosarcina sp. MSH10X1]